MEGFFNTFKLDRAERWAARLSLMGLMFSLFLIYDDSIIDRIFPPEDLDVTQPLVGQMVFMENDSRYKNSSSMQWKKSQGNQEIRLGDSIFNGDNSKSKIKLNKGGSVTIGENSLLLFNEVDGVSMPSLSGGNYDLEVDGNLKVTIDGQLTEFTGTNSKVQVVVKKNEKPQLKLISGEAKIRTNIMAPQELKKDTLVKIEVPRPAPQVEQIFTPVMTPTAPEIQEQKSATYNYYFKLYDLYKKETAYSFRREESPQLGIVSLGVELSWSSQGAPKQSTIQISKDINFESIITEETVSQSNMTTKKLSLGENYWRVSNDQILWSNPAVITVQSRFIQLTPPELLISDSKPKLFGGKATIDLSFKTDLYLKGYLLEKSFDSNFGSASTTAYWIGKNQTSWTVTSADTNYFRVRGVTDSLELTNFSNLIRVDPEIPVILAEVIPLKPRVKVKKAEIAVMKKHSETLVQQIERQPTQMQEITITTKVETPSFMNDSYKNSSVRFFGGMFSMFSATQISRNSESPVALMGGFQLMHWFSHSGLDLMLKSKISGINPAARESSPTIADLKLKYRFLLPYNLFSRQKEMQLDFGVGYENYRNSGSTTFSNAHDIYKAGFGLDFPVANRMTTGGDFYYGKSTGGGQKTEVSGYLGYYLKKNISLDAGYRVNFFESGNGKESPTGLVPYREAYGEAYSGFLWNY